MMRLVRRLTLAAVLAGSSASLAAGAAVPPASSPAQTTPRAATVAAPHGPPKICLDARTRDDLTREFAAHLRRLIAASGSLTLASATDSCDLQLHVPGNLLRFETAGGVMVGTVVIVTSSSGRYLSTSITACQAGDLEPCAARAVAAAKLALLLTSNGTS